MEFLPLKVILWLLVFLETSSQYVYTQLFDNLYFSPTTRQILLRPNLGTFNFTKQYTLWGWYKFSGETPAISNILSMRNLELIQSNTGVIRPFPDPEFPPCGASLEQINADPRYLSVPEIANNPNCFPDRSDPTLARGSEALYKTSTDILYINYDLTSFIDYSFIFLIQTGLSQVGNSDMRVLGFTKIPLFKNVWSYFAISCDYQAGVATAYFRAFDGFTQAYTDTARISYPQFTLTPLTQLVIAGVETNPYFESASGFIGNIALIEIGLFYTPDLALLWAGFMPLSGYANNGILLDLLFDVYRQGDALTSRGQIAGSYPITGSYTPVYSLDNNLVGVRFSPTASVPLSNLDFNNDSSLIKTMTFMFNLNYTEPLQDPFYLIQKGVPNSNGYFALSLVKAGNGRSLKMDAYGVNGPASWTSSEVFQPNTRYQFASGIALSPNSSAHAVYWDSQGRFNVFRLSDYFPYSTAGSDFILLGNQGSLGENGGINLYRFTALSSMSNLLYYYLLSQTQDRNIIEMNRNCLLRTSYYGNDYSCLLCRDSILTMENRQCVNYCPWGTKNAFNDVCLPCINPDCSEINSTMWLIFKVDDNNYILKPSRPIISNIDYNNLFRINIPGVNQTDYTYFLTPNATAQTVALRFNFTRPIINQGFIVTYLQDRTNPQFDINRNILYVTNSTAIANSTASSIITNRCFVDRSAERALIGLAITTLVLMAALAAIVLALSLCCWTRIFDLGGIWKFLLHHWMRLQMVSFFLFLAIYMPCCIKEFLGQLYRIAVSWNHALGGRINDINQDNRHFIAGLEYKPLSPQFRQWGPYPNPAPQQFLEYGVFPFLLHNLGVFFIVQLAIAFFYIILKVWDWIKPTTGTCLYYIFNFFEYTLLIVGYALIAMQAFVFAGLNFRLSYWDYHYFTISFVIAILYILVFALFWLYAAARLLGPVQYFYNPINYNKFYYFFAGYRPDKWARTYDLWFWLAYFIVGMVIGLLFDHRLPQLIIIVAVLAVLLLITILLRPFRSILMLIVDLIVQAMILAAVIIFLIIAIHNNNGCIDSRCTDIDFEGKICWAIVMLLFLALLLSFLGILAHLALSACLGDKYKNWGRPVKEIVQTNYVTTTQDIHTQAVNDQYINANQAVYKDTNMMARDNVVATQTGFASNVYQGSAVNVGGGGYASDAYATGLAGAALGSTAVVGAGMAGAGAGKSMREFMNEIKADTMPADVSLHNVTYQSGIVGDTTGYNRAGALTNDQADEENAQPNILRTLSNSQVVSDAQFANPNQGISYVNSRKEQFYQQARDAALAPDALSSAGFAADPLSAMDYRSTSGMGPSAYQTATIAPGTQYVTTTTTVNTGAPSMMAADRMSSMSGGMAADNYTVLRSDNTPAMNFGMPGQTFEQRIEQTRRNF